MSYQWQFLNWDSTHLNALPDNKLRTYEILDSSLALGNHLKAMKYRSKKSSTRPAASHGKSCIRIKSGSQLSDVVVAETEQWYYLSIEELFVVHQLRFSGPDHESGSVCAVQQLISLRHVMGVLLYLSLAFWPTCRTPLRRLVVNSKTFYWNND